MAHAAALIAAFFIVLAAPVRSAPDMLAPFIDPLDGQLDASRWLLDNAHGFLPVPMVFNEPAIGVGGGVSLLFFHPRGEEGEGEGEGATIDTDITGLTAFASDNGSWGGGLFHSAAFFDDRLRSLSAAFHFDVNLDFYPLQGSRGVGMTNEVDLAFQRLQWQPWQPPLYLGLDLLWLRTDTRFGLDRPIPGLPAITDELTDTALGLTVQWDSRDNRYSPEDGLNAMVSHQWHEPDLGADHAYQRTKVYGHWFEPLGEDWYWSSRASVIDVDGEVPFYLKPYIDMRGLPALRYQGNRAGSVEGEVRYQLTPRWSLLAFAGSGWADEDQLSGSPSRVMMGGGFRYRIARLLGLQMGLDWAHGPEENVLYIQFGHAWVRD